MLTRGRCRRQAGVVLGRLALRIRLLLSVPALAIGGNNGLQVSQAAALAAIPFLVARPPGRSFGRSFVAGFRVRLDVLNRMLADAPLPDVLVKESIAITLAYL